MIDQPTAEDLAIDLADSYSHYRFHVGTAVYEQERGIIRRCHAAESARLAAEAEVAKLRAEAERHRTIYAAVYAERTVDEWNRLSQRITALEAERDAARAEVESAAVLRDQLRRAAESLRPFAGYPCVSLVMRDKMCDEGSQPCVPCSTSALLAEIEPTLTETPR